MSNLNVVNFVNGVSIHCNSHFGWIY